MSGEKLTTKFDEEPKDMRKISLKELFYLKSL